jgi:hypothetical protein
MTSARINGPSYARTIVRGLLNEKVALAGERLGPLVYLFAHHESGRKNATAAVGFRGVADRQDRWRNFASKKGLVCRTRAFQRCGAILRLILPAAAQRNSRRFVLPRQT